MAHTVTIYGAGSIGNHLAHACRLKGWAVTICDLDDKALARTRDLIYPQRYGSWDQEIRLVHLREPFLKEPSDLVIIGTPPDAHLDLARAILKGNPPRVMLIEKPLCPPDLEGCAELAAAAAAGTTTVLVGYNHTLTGHTRAAESLLREKNLGRPLYLYAAFREHWAGIFAAHPWLKGPEDSYLGYTYRGGGAGGEHSHAINIWQHFAGILGMGRIIEVMATVDWVSEGGCSYDRIIQINVRSEKGLTGHIVQDVVTSPPSKQVSIQGEKGMLEWQVNRDGGHDALRHNLDEGEVTDLLFPKTRPDDFKGEIEHIADLLAGRVSASPLSLARGLETMLVLAAAHLSHQWGKKIVIDYRAGYSTAALREQ